MRHPESPPQFDSLWHRRSSEFLGASQSERYADYVRSAQKAYEPWSKTKYRAAGKGLDPELAWLLIQMERKTGRKWLPLVDASGAELSYVRTDEIDKQLMFIDQELAGRLGQPTPHAVANEDKERYIINSLMEEAVASSLLEGAPTTRKDAKQMLREGKSPRNLGERMVANNYNAMLFVRDHLDTKLTPSFVHRIHTILCEGTMPEEEIGRWRRNEDDVKVIDDRDDEVMHDPPDADSLAWRLDKLFKFANRSWRSNKDFLHPVVQAIAIHFMFGYEHPYCDGNGRVARALFYWSVLRNGYYLFEFLPLSARIRNSPIAYGMAFFHAEQDGFDLGYFLAHQLRMIALARDELHAYLKREISKRQAAEDLVGNDDRLNARQKLVLYRLHQSSGREISIAEHQSREGVSYPTANQDLQGLVDREYLTSRKVGKKLLFGLKPR